MTQCGLCRSATCAGRKLASKCGFQPVAWQLRERMIDKADKILRLLRALLILSVAYFLVSIVSMALQLTKQ